MKRIALLALLFVTISVHAQTLTLERGDVIAQNRLIYSEILMYPPVTDDVAVADSFGIPKPGVAFPDLSKHLGSGLFVVDQHRAIYSTSNGMFEWRAGGIGGSSVSLFLDFLYGGEILRMRNGDLLIAEVSSLIGVGRPLIVRVTPAGEVRGIYAIADAPMRTETEYAGVAHMDLLADQCTLLWTPNTKVRRQVRTFDICSGSEKADFLDATPQFESDIQRIGSIRALPNGDVLIATQKDVRRFDRSGKKVATYKTPETIFIEPPDADTLLALTPDASGVWIGRYFQTQRIDFASPSSPAVLFQTNAGAYLFALGVIGEWRAAEQPPPVPKRRSVR